MDAASTVGPEIAGALARFWAGGAGPSHASISTAFALAGYNEPNEERNKQERVLYAVRGATEHTAKLLVEELLSLLRAAGRFDGEWVADEVASAQTAFARGGHILDSQGYVEWNQSQTEEGTVGPSDETPTSTAGTVGPQWIEVQVPDALLLIDSLRRLATAVRPLFERRRNRRGFAARDEYDLQDLVEFLLRSLYNDVRVEERTPSYAGSSSVMDFLLKDDAIAVEVKVTARGRAERNIKPELLVDIDDYRQHPNVQTLIAVIYDLASTIRNPASLENDLSGSRNGLHVRVVVVGWPLGASGGEWADAERGTAI